jgi:hypothetical protein
MSRILIPIALLLPPLGGCGEATSWMPGGRDCSVVRWDRGQAFCVVVPAPAPPPFCARALGGVDCWADPGTLANRPRGLADNPAAPLATRKEPGTTPAGKEPGPKAEQPPPMPVAKGSHATDYRAL